MNEEQRKYILSFKDEDPLLMAYVEGQKHPLPEHDARVRKDERRQWRDEHLDDLVWMLPEEEEKRIREEVLDKLDIDLEELKSCIESSSLGDPISVLQRGRIIGISDARIKIKAMRGKP